MSTISEGIAPGIVPLQYPHIAQDCWLSVAHKRLSQVLETAREIPFDDASRFVFLSDCHRGDKSRVDAFARNEALFLHALNEYYQAGFTYIEVGDGDELWQNRRLGDVLRAHPRTFDLLHEFDRHGRLHLIIGNHDIPDGKRDGLDKDGMIAHEGLILRHAKTGQRVFVVHGHQADYRSDQMIRLSRFVIRHIWRKAQYLGLRNVTLWANQATRQNKAEQKIVERLQAHKKRIEQRIVEWAEANHQMVICGHTHRPAHPRCSLGADRQIRDHNGAPPYFNTGSCVVPGQITGFEIQNGQIVPVRWSAMSGIGEELALPRVTHARREALAPARELRFLS